jgi:hypothetical protein
MEFVPACGGFIIGSPVTVSGRENADWQLADSSIAATHNPSQGLVSVRTPAF